MMNRQKVQLPVSIQNKMAMWREGLISMPKEYIDFHHELGKKELEKLADEGLIVEESFIKGDGWFDGMQVLHVKGKWNDIDVELHWHNGNQEFFYQSDAGGSSPFRLCRDKIKPKPTIIGEVYQVVTMKGAKYYDSVEDMCKDYQLTGYSQSKYVRKEIQNKPTFQGLAGAMYNGVDEDGKVVIRYEDWKVYEMMSN